MHHTAFILSNSYTDNWSFKHFDEHQVGEGCTKGLRLKPARKREQAYPVNMGIWFSCQISISHAVDFHICQNSSWSSNHCKVQQQISMEFELVTINGFISWFIPLLHMKIMLLTAVKLFLIYIGKWITKIIFEVIPLKSVGSYATLLLIHTYLGVNSIEYIILNLQ